MPDLQPGHPPLELRIQLLGGFSITIGERHIAAGQFRLRKSRSLVKLLALAPNHRLQRDQLLELLWPDQDPQAAANNFYQALFEARRILDPMGANPQRYLQLNEGVLSLCPEIPILIDADTFKTAANRAFRTQDQAAYQAALDLYPGDLLPEDLYEEWCRETRQALHQDHLRLLLGLAKLLEKQQEFGESIESFKQALYSDSLNEEAHAGLMRLYAATGQRQLALRQYQILAEALERELEAQPDPGIARLYQEILSGSYSPAQTRREPQPVTGQPSPPGNNLPVQMTSFIGREQEKREIKRLLVPRLVEAGQLQEKESIQGQPARLVTLTGAGGCGKTRLALETAGELLEQYRDGVWLAELAGLSDPDLLPQTLISVLHLHSTGGQPRVSTLADYLKPRQLLLVLDNCEHLVGACARLAETLLKNCPNLQILATSQEILGLPGEVSYPVSPLSLPDPLSLLPPELAGQSEAVRLFAERARYAAPDFTLNESNAPAVAHICRRLDGIPLAIELAAARVKMMQVEEIAARLEQSFDLLTGGSRTALPRYQSLDASIRWSYGLLSEAEKLLFRRLAVFTSGWEVEAARYVAASRDQPSESPQLTDGVLDLLTQLVNKSLVIPHPIPNLPTRYSYLDTIRRFALDRLKETGEEGLIQDRHLDYYEQLAIRLGPQIRGPDQVPLMSRLEAEHDNLRTALEWSLANHLPAIQSAGGYQIGYPQIYIEKGLRLGVA